MVPHKTKSFFIELGETIAETRKEVGLTQEQLASFLGINQPVLASYEIGRRRIPIPILVKIAEVLNVYVEDILPIKHLKKKRGPKPKIDRELEKVKFLPEDQQKVILNLIKTLTETNLKVS